MTGWSLVGEAANEAALGLLLKVTLVLAGGIAASIVLRGASAAVRHAALVAALTAAVALPGLAILLPAWEVPVFDVATDERAAVAAASRSGMAPARPPVPPSATPAEASPAQRLAAPPHETALAEAAPMSSRPASPEASRGPWMALLLGAWGVGLLIGLGRAGLDVARTGLLVRDAVRDPDGPQVRRCRRIARRLGIRRPVRVLFSERLSVPATLGVLRPVVVLPIEAREWDPETSRIVLLHELAHVRRLDWLSIGLVEAASALWWFHPLLWPCRRRLRVEQERACDDIVILGGVRPTDYAGLLVDFARDFPPMAGTPAARATIAMARPSTLRDRVETILASGSRRLRLGRRTVALVGLAVTAIVLPLAAVHLWGETTDARETARLIASLSDDDPAAREAAAWSLGARRSEVAVEPLIGRLADADARVRGMAARALGKIGDGRAFDPVANLLGDPDPGVRELAAQSLAEFEDEGRVAALAPLLDDPDVDVRSVTVSVLGGLPDPRAVEALAGVLRDEPDPHTREMAIYEIAKLGDAARAAVPALVRLLEEETELAAPVAWLLGEIGDERAVPALVASVGAGDEEVRDAAVDALAGFAAEPIVVEAVLVALRDPVWRIRSSAAEVLGRSRDERAVPALLDALGDPVHQVRLHAAWALDELEASGVR